MIIVRRAGIRDYKKREFLGQEASKRALRRLRKEIERLQRDIHRLKKGFGVLRGVELSTCWYCRKCGNWTPVIEDVCDSCMTARHLNAPWPQVFESREED